MTQAADVPSRLASALAGRYRIDREIGSGGMATVYVARDLRHGRDVAIKVLHPDLGAALGADRFLAEIHTTARLQHPHILPLLDSGDAGGLLYYVMPFVAGETLRARLERERQLSIDDAVRIAREVADALHYAHSAGIIHRDIKPENILLQGGHALVADFGIALAVQHAGGQRMTQTGLSLGTPQYMSPEQAMGEKAIDARTDIYALGAVTYEMLAGNPPFTGTTVQAIVAKVLAERPTSLRTQRDTVPPAVERAIVKALAKLPADRYASAAEFAAALADQSAQPAQWRDEDVRQSRLRDPLVLGLGAGVVLLAATAATLATRSGGPSIDTFPIRVEIKPDSGLIGPGVLSPDGQTLVYPDVWRTENGSYYVRRLDQLSSRLIPGTQGAWHSPAFSPDGKWIAFIQGRRRLVKVPLDGGAPVTLATVPEFGGVDWAPNGEIILGAGVDEGLQGLFRVSDIGGQLVPLTRVDTARKELSHQSPRVLSDGKTVLFMIWLGSPESAELAVTSLDDGEVVPLGIRGRMPLDVIDGLLVYLNSDGLVMAVPFDTRAKRTSGTPMVVQDSIRYDGAGGAARDEVSLTHQGGLVYVRGNRGRGLVWVDRSGRSSPAVGVSREWAHVRLSPNARQAAVTIATGPKRDVWTLDLADGTLAPLTTTGASRNPMWSRDGRRILYASTHGGRAAFWWQPADGSGEPQLAVDPQLNPWFADLSPDGRTIVFNAIEHVNFDLRSISLDSAHEARVLSGSPTALEAYGRFSPNGRWVAYNSDESGRMEVYVRPFDGAGGRVLVSVAGGRRPIWSRDGKQLYYWEDDRLISAVLRVDSTVSVVSRTPLFSGRYEDDFDVSPDGTRFLMIEAQTTGLSLIAIPNWRTELKRLMAARGAHR